MPHCLRRTRVTARLGRREVETGDVYSIAGACASPGCAWLTPAEMPLAVSEAALPAGELRMSLPETLPEGRDYVVILETVDGGVLTVSEPFWVSAVQPEPTELGDDPIDAEDTRGQIVLRASDV